MELTSKKSYLLKAIYEWVIDNEATPYLEIFAENPLVQVPQQFVIDGKITLKITPSAVENLLIDHEGISFNARFGGKPHSIYTPIGAVLAIYASETREGLFFGPEEFDDGRPPDDEPPKSHLSDASADKGSDQSKKTKKAAKRPSLKVVK